MSRFTLSVTPENYSLQAKLEKCYGVASVLILDSTSRDHALVA